MKLSMWSKTTIDCSGTFDDLPRVSSRDFVWDTHFILGPGVLWEWLGDLPMRASDFHASITQFETVILTVIDLESPWHCTFQ